MQDVIAHVYLGGLKMVLENECPVECNAKIHRARMIGKFCPSHEMLSSFSHLGFRDGS